MNHFERRTKRLRENYLKKVGKKKEINYEKEVEKYHNGRGWYELPNVEGSMRKDEAIKLLKESDK